MKTTTPTNTKALAGANQNNQVNYTSLIMQADAIGLSIERLSACNQIGKFYRIALAGKPKRNTDGYVKWLSTDCCVMGNWVTGDKVVWFDNSQSLSPHELAERQRKAKEAQQRAEIQQLQLWQETALKAQSLWQRAQPADDQHAYLVRKQLRANGLKQQAGAIMVPVFDAITSNLQSLQFINTDGTKRFLTNGKMTNGFYACRPYQHDETVVIAEGWATSESLQQHWQVPAWHLAAFSASNLINIAKAIRNQLPEVKIIIAGDADASGVGQIAANQAALIARAEVALPTFTDAERQKHPKISDWLDRWHLDQQGGRNHE